MKTSLSINRRQFVGTASAAALSLAAKPTFSIGGKAKPNFLFLITDQHHIRALSAMGNPHVKTPMIDTLVQQGTTFEESYCTYPLCSPSRASMFTSRMACENGVYENGRAIIPSMPNLGQWFREQSGYETYYTGKWHVPQPATHNIPGFTVLAPGISGQGNIGDWSVSDACAGYLMNRKSANPFLFVASLTQPHDICQWLRINVLNQKELRYPELLDQLPPLPANFRYDEKEPDSQIKLRLSTEPFLGGWEELHWRYYLWSYYRNVEMADADIGRILDALETAGLANETLVLFTADHGEGCAHHQMVRKSGLYDESAKVPFVVRWAGEIKENIRQTKRLVSGLDIFPTLCDYAGIELPQGSRGCSVRPSLEGKDDPGHDYIAIESHNGRGNAIRTQQFKLISFLNDPVEQLFDRQNDPGETKNVVEDSAFASVLQDLRTLRQDWINRMVYADDFPKPNRRLQG